MGRSRRPARRVLHARNAAACAGVRSGRSVAQQRQQPETTTELLNPARALYEKIKRGEGSWHQQVLSYTAIMVGKGTPDWMQLGGRQAGAARGAVSAGLAGRIRHRGLPDRAEGASGRALAALASPSGSVHRSRSPRRGFARAGDRTIVSRREAKRPTIRGSRPPRRCRGISPTGY